MICLYGYWSPDLTPPSSSTANELIDSVRLDARQSATLARSIRALSLEQPRGTVSCPNDMVGVGALLAFTYADGSTTDLNYHDTGCQRLDNGKAAASQIGSKSFGDLQTTLTSEIAAHSHPGGS